MKYLIILAMLLAGCAKPAVRVETVVVKVPVATACMDHAEVAKILDPARVVFTGNAQTDVRIAAAQGLRLWEVVKDLRAAMSGCVSSR